MPYARDQGGLQFVSQQGNDHYISASYWLEVIDQTGLYHRDGEFVAFLGYE